MKGATANMPNQIHPDLLNQGESKRGRVQALFGEISNHYDQLNRIMSFNRDRAWRTYAASQLNLKPGDSALDLCCGTGDFCAELQKQVTESGTIIGLDFSLPMIKLATNKYPQTDFALADALAIPLRSNSVSGVTVGWGIRNVSDYDRAHQEIFRVLKSGGHFASLDMALPEGKAASKLSRWSLGLFLPLLGRLFGNRNAYQYLHQSTATFWSRQQLSDSMANAGFINIKTKNFMMGNICLHWGEKP